MSRSLPVLQPRDLTPTPLFDRVAIVGLGLVGGSLAMAIRRTWPKCLVIGVDRKDVVEQAMRLHAVDVAADDLVVAAEAHLIVLAAPVRQNISLLAELDAHVPGACLVTDVSSTKADIVAAAAASLPARFTFLGGHPLAGAARGGIEHARADLFADRPWIFTPTPNVDPSSIETLSAFVTALGARPHVMPPHDHDHVVAFLSHLPQLTVSALMSVVGGAVGEPGLALAGRGLVDTTRLASSPPEVWKDIAVTNASAIGAALDLLIHELQTLRQGLADGSRLDEVFVAAAKWRDALMRSREG